MKTAIVGGGAAGFFLAVNLKEMMPQMEVTLFERSRRVLAKVEVSGGGRCNCTNTFASVSDLCHVYPRGHRLMKRLFNIFDHRDAYSWFERHGVPLTAQTDGCIFPRSQDSHTIIRCLSEHARRSGVRILTGQRIESLEQLDGFDFIAVTTGGQPRAEGLQWLSDAGHEVVPPVPSLFTFSIADERLRSLMGTVAEHATASIAGTNHRAAGPLLITHWGMSGPAILKTSSYAARMLHDCGYRAPLSINWSSRNDGQMLQELQAMAARNGQKQIAATHHPDIPQRLWAYLAEKSLGERAHLRWQDASRKDLNRLCNTLCNDGYQTAGRAAFKDEFVTCGGISLRSIHPSTLESRHRPRLFFAGEVLDIDGITGGFNFQAAWTTAFCVARSIAHYQP